MADERSMEESGISPSPEWVAAYQAIASRHNNSDHLRRQIPAFGIAAEAILINAAIVVVDSERVRNIAAVGIGLMTAVTGIYITWLIYEHSRLLAISRQSGAPTRTPGFGTL